ncbi:MAG: hypothetical protein OJF55_001884 [Rhodanobacteraceae bacterium]|nr:MAG: hypothetical protein OJF55_001884 [Rhodanobacteraceae bacterium]
MQVGAFPAFGRRGPQGCIGRHAGSGSEIPGIVADRSAGLGGCRVARSVQARPGMFVMRAAFSAVPTPTPPELCGKPQCCVAASLV